MSAFVNTFIDSLLPQMWKNQLAVMGISVNYWPGGDLAQSVPLTVVWIDGAENEETAPGRYSHVRVQNTLLPSQPAPGDALEKDGSVFDVVKVNAYTYGFATLILQER